MWNLFEMQFETKNIFCNIIHNSRYNAYKINERKKERKKVKRSKDRKIDIGYFLFGIAKRVSPSTKIKMEFKVADILMKASVVSFQFATVIKKKIHHIPIEKINPLYNKSIIHIIKKSQKLNCYYSFGLLDF